MNPSYENPEIDVLDVQIQPKILKFHIVYLSGKTTEEGTSLSSGVTLEAFSMLEALAAFHKDVATVEPIYVFNLSCDLPKVGTNKNQ